MENINPRQVMDTVEVPAEDFETLEVGDLVRCQGWSRPRVIVNAEENAGGKYIFLADPDSRFDEAPRRIEGPEFQQRGPWVKYPHLGQLWRSFQKLVDQAGGASKGGPGGFKFL